MYKNVICSIAIMMSGLISCSSSQKIVAMNDEDYKIPKTSSVAIVSATSVPQNRAITSGLIEMLTESGHRNILSQKTIDDKYLAKNESFPLSESEISDEIDKIHKAVRADCVIFVISDFATVQYKSYTNGNTGAYVSVPVSGYIFLYPLGVCVGEIHYIPEKSTSLFDSDDETAKKLLKKVLNNINAKLDGIIEK